MLKLFIYPIYSNVQRVSVSEVTLAVDSQLGAKLVSTDRGQASEVSVTIVSSQRQQIVQMTHVKNARGGPGDEDPRHPPRLPTDAKGKATKKLATKKRKYLDADTARADIVAATVECAEAGGARSGVHIADQLSLAQRAAV